MTLRSFLRTVREGYAVVLVTVAIAVAAAIVVLLTQPASYRASAYVHVKVGLPEGADAESLEAAVEYANARTITYEALVDSDAVLEPVIESLDLDVTPRVLAGQVAGISALDTNIIQIRVTWSDAEESAAIANAIADELADEVEIESDEIEVDLVTVTRAEAATSPVVPNPAMTIGLAVFAALLVSTAGLLVRASRRAAAATRAEA